MPSDSTDEATEIRPRKSLKLLSIYPSHAERKQKAQFIEDPKHTHRGKQGVGGSLSESGGRRRGVGFYFCGLCFSPVHPPTQSYFTPHYVIKIYYQTTQKLVTLNLGEAQFFSTLLTNSPGITRYTEKHK